MSFRVEYLGLCGKWLSYCNGQTEMGAMRVAMARKKAMDGRAVRVLNNAGHVVALF